MQCESTQHIALGTGSHSPENSDLTTAGVPKSRGATMNRKKGGSTARNKRNLESGTCWYMLMMHVYYCTKCTEDEV